MSEPQLISPMLDGFIMGDPISNHNGVRCCPAMQTETEHKYIVKVISIPATQAKLDALLLAGAFSDKSSALDYFKELSDGIEQEAALLQRLSRLEGFVPYESWQSAAMEDGETGYDVYLLGAYRPTLEYKLQRNELTHLDAVNLGLDLCAALSVCRRLGYLYVDLKPSNVYICNEREYRIGDIGFLPLSSLPYASLPEKYHSAYTAPEITDAYSTLNDTLDVYAAGMILYQAFNGGQLPSENTVSREPLSPPQYADAEMAEIILKACAENSEDRWKDPTQMGQALISYLQRNNVNDVSIIPSDDEVEAGNEEDDEDTENQEPTTSQILAEVDEALEKENTAPESEVAEEANDAEKAEAAKESDAADQATESDHNESPDVNSEEEVQPEAEDVQGQAISDGNNTAETEEDENHDDLSSESDAGSVPGDAPVEDTVEGEPEQSPEDDILAHADDLIAHQLPDPVVAPEPIDVPVPQSEDPESQENTEETPAEDTAAGEDAAGEAEKTVGDTNAESKAQPEAPVPAAADPAPKSRHSLTALLTAVLIAIVVGFSSYLFYEYYYLQTVYGITLQGREDRLAVVLNSEIDDSLLTVVCTDSYGNTLKEKVTSGIAVFSQLRPGTAYKIQVQIEGFHKLTGKTLDTYTTSEQTFISDIRAITGSEDGSVILSFTVQGPESSRWTVHYSAPGEAEGTASCSGHAVTITGLTVGKEYTFRIEPSDSLYMGGENTLKFTPSKVIYAEDLTILGFNSKSLTAVWKVPEGVSVSSWTVRCYNDAGFDETVTVTEPKAVFENMDHTSAYNIEVTAEGMTVGSRTYLSANSVTFHKINADGTDLKTLKVSWEFEGVAPEGGWLLLYTVDGSEQQVIKCTASNGVITPLIPGAHYEITVQPANGATCFGGTQSYDAPKAVPFSGYQVKADNITLKMCITPKKNNWNRYDVPKSAYRTSFQQGVSASFVMHLTREYSKSSDKIVTLYVIRDAEGKIVSNATESRTWTSMWYRGYGKLTIPFMPENPGQYTLEIYFNGTALATQNFEVLPAPAAKA